MEDDFGYVLGLEHCIEGKYYYGITHDNGMLAGLRSDGIIGFGPSPQNNFVLEMFEQGIIDKPQLSISLAKEQTRGNSELIFGENFSWENYYSEGTHHSLYGGFYSVSDELWAFEVNQIHYSRKQISKYERQKEDDSKG